MKRIGIEYAVSVSEEEVYLLLRGVKALLREFGSGGEDAPESLGVIMRDLEDILDE